MSALIIDFAEARERTQSARSTGQRRAETPAVSGNAPTGRERFHFWTGNSGARYVHTVYDLVSCPTLPASNYMLIKRTDAGELDVLAIGQVSNSATSLNLAEVRRHGAELGATEVHVHLLAEDRQQAKQIQQDLQTGYLNATWTSPRSALAQ